MTQNPDWVNVILSVLLLLGYGLHLWFSLRLWLAEHSGRSLRNLLIAAMIEVAMVAFIFGALGRIYPAWIEPARFVGAIVRGILLPVAIVVCLTWLLPSRALRAE